MKSKALPMATTTWIAVSARPKHFLPPGNLLQAAIIIDGCMQRKGWVKVSN